MQCSHYSVRNEIAFAQFAVGYSVMNIFVIDIRRTVAAISGMILMIMNTSKEYGNMDNNS